MTTALWSPPHAVFLTIPIVLLAKNNNPSSKYLTEAAFDPFSQIANLLA